MNPTVLYIANLAVYFLIYVCLTTGLNLSFGMTGILDFAYITFMAIGAYVGGVAALGPEQAGSGITYILGLSWPWPFGLLLGALAAVSLGLLFSLVAMRRLRSDYMAIVMVALWTVTWDLVGNEPKLFNGQIGIVGVPQPFSGAFGTDPLTYVYVFLVLSLLVAAILVYISLCIERSSLGLTLRAIREDEDVAAAFGKAVFRNRLKAMALSCAFAGIGGALTIEFVDAMNPSGWGIAETFIVFSALLLGGRGNVIGAIFGALVVRIGIIEGTSLLPSIPGHPDLLGAVRNIAIGTLLILVLYFRPQGLFPERRGRYEPKPKPAALRRFIGREPQSASSAVGSEGA